MKLGILLCVAGAALVSGCGDDPTKACFATADHAKYSDARITAICGCALRQAKLWGVADTDGTLLAAAIRGKAADAGDRARAQSLGKLWSMAMASCQKD